MAIPSRSLLRFFEQPLLRQVSSSTSFQAPLSLLHQRASRFANQRFLSQLGSPSATTFLDTSQQLHAIHRNDVRRPSVTMFLDASQQFDATYRGAVHRPSAMIAIPHDTILRSAYWRANYQASTSTAQARGFNTQTPQTADQVKAGSRSDAQVHDALIRDN